MASRVINTGLYGNRAFEILSNMLKFTKNEFAKSKRTTMKLRSLKALECKRNIDDEIIFTGEFDHWRLRDRTIFEGMTKEHVLNHVVWLFKLQLMKMYARSIGEYFCGNVNTLPKVKKFWNRKNATEFTPSHMYNFKISANEMYYIYEKLKGRKNIDRHYDEKLIENIVGVSLDPITVEMKSALYDEIQRLEAERDLKTNELNKQKHSEIKLATDTINKKFDILTTDIHNEYHTKILTLQKEIKSLMSVEAIV